MSRVEKDVGYEVGRINRRQKEKGVECCVQMFNFVLEVVRECGCFWNRSVMVLFIQV